MVIDIIYRYDPARPSPLRPPATPAEAQRRLEDGNREFAQLLEPVAGDQPQLPRILPFDPEDLGLAEDAGTAPHQQPFAAVLGCADARVPIELIFNQGCNDLFVVRVAGNVLGSECLGSFDYALDHLRDSLKLLVVLGHSRCGAVTAAVDAFLTPARYLSVASSHPLRAIVDRLFVSVRGSARALEEIWGGDIVRHPRYRHALIETGVAVNAALTAATLRHEFAAASGQAVGVVFGVYDLVHRRVNVPGGGADGQDTPGLASPPTDQAGFRELGVHLGGCDRVRSLLQ